MADDKKLLLIYGGFLMPEYVDDPKKKFSEALSLRYEKDGTKIFSIGLEKDAAKNWFPYPTRRLSRNSVISLRDFLNDFIRQAITQ